MLPPVFVALRDAHAVTSLIGTSPVRAYRHGSAPQNVTAPYVTWSAAGGYAENAFDGADADVFRIVVDCWSDGDAQVEQLAKAVRSAIEPHAHLQGYESNERDADTQRYRIGMSFDWILDR